MKFLELFNRTVPWEYSDESKPGLLVAEFMLADDGLETKYEVYFVEEADEEMLASMDTPFESNTGGVWNINFTSRLFHWKTGYGLKSASKTGGGNELTVFSTVLDIIDKTVNRYGINNITFSAAKREPSRIKLYNRMTQTLASSWFVVGPEVVDEHFRHLRENPEHATWLLLRK